MQKIATIIFSFCFIFANAQTETMNKKIEIHGHRGFRGHFPENTLTAFKEAVQLGVDAIELDVVISKDSQVVVSHEPWFNYKICSEPNGEPVKARKQHNLYKLNYAEIRQFDCGKRGNKEFPQQKAIPEYKPLLKDVIESIEKFTKENNLPSVHYNIEIKSMKIGDGKWHPKPSVVAKLVMDILDQYKINDRVLMQSFDVRSLQAIHKIEPQLKIGLLIMNTGSVQHNIKKLGFTPYAYNPAAKLVKAKTIKDAHEYGCKVIVWTVNTESEMKKLIKLGVDGLISDYPNLALMLH